MEEDQRRLLAAALTNSGPHDISAGNSLPEMDMMTPEKLQELIWFFRTEDPSTWNYCILGLSFAVLFLGVVLLALNVVANRNRKSACSHSEEYKDAQPNGTETKQGFVSLQEEATTESLLPTVQNAGEVSVQWKDGNVTTLYAGASEAEA
ncbi:PREDICTED: organic solute transporter subunit beta [Gekko japonicus]|uniref:Organic solute transporter subunit beta n=1 Tax=Gekko japonicus TaxID=146911 RepID=A0ABM1L9I8_GEKJA|nr:PREDICTED: organic solute transporter subunit beta [Gekko japonicus]